MTIPKCVKLNRPCKIHLSGKFSHWSCGEYDPKQRRLTYLSHPSICKECGNKCSQFTNMCRKCSSKKLWKGDNASYSAKHKWLSRNVIKPKHCQHCKKVKKLHWANKSGNYLRDLSDWIAICVQCHCKYDNNYPPIQTKEFRKTYM